MRARSPTSTAETRVSPPSGPQHERVDHAEDEPSGDVMTRSEQESDGMAGQRWGKQGLVDRGDSDERADIDGEREERVENDRAKQKSPPSVGPRSQDRYSTSSMTSTRPPDEKAGGSV